MAVTGPEQLYQRFVECFGVGDLYELVQLYSVSAVLTTEAGSTSYGSVQITETLRAWLELRGGMSLATRFQMQSGDSALMSASWRFEYDIAGQRQILSGVSADACRRTKDDDWVFVCSNWHAQLTSREAQGKPVIYAGSADDWTA